MTTVATCTSHGLLSTTLLILAMISVSPKASGGQAGNAAAGASGGPVYVDVDKTWASIKTTKIADNFYVLTGPTTTGGNAGGAIGVLTGPDGVFMVDAQFAPMTDEVVAAIKQVSNAPIRFVVNTHSHVDHTQGNPNLAKMGVTIFARPELRAALVAQKGFDPAGLPVITYTSPLTFHMDGDQVVLIPVPPAHTDGDTMIYFRHTDVLMTGDFFRSGYPNIGGNVNGMIDALGMAIAMCGPNTKVVPGHGAIGNRTDLIAHRDMVVKVRDRIAELIKEGKTQDEVLAARPTADYDAVVLKDIAQFYDETTFPGYKNSDRFVKQVYAQLKGAK